MKATVQVRVLDSEAFKSFVERVQEFIAEYAWHDRSCATVDCDGEWHRGNPACTCGYDEALAGLIPPEPKP